MVVPLWHTLVCALCRALACLTVWSAGNYAHIVQAKETESFPKARVFCEWKPRWCLSSFRCRARLPAVAARHSCLAVIFQWGKRVMLRGVTCRTSSGLVVVSLHVLNALRFPLYFRGQYSSWDWKLGIGKVTVAFWCYSRAGSLLYRVVVSTNFMPISELFPQPERICCSWKGFIRV